MAYQTHVYDNSPTIRAEAAAAIENPAMLAVEMTNGKMTLPAAGDPIIGIVLADHDDVAAGDPVHVQIKDICLWMAGGTFTAGAMLKTDAAGKCVAAAAGDVVNAIALDDGKANLPCRVYITHTVVPAAGA